VLSWGPLILGHASPEIVEAAKKAMENGASFGAPTSLEIDMAQMVQDFYPSLKKLRFVSSGTEACMGAIRAARGYTGRDKIIKFEGCYHGGADYLLVKAGSGAATLGSPDSDGVPASFAEHTIVVPFNDIEAVEHAFAEYGPEIAAVIVEPIAGNMGLIMPEPGFLDALRNLTTHHDSVLIFDEVLVGFRTKGGAQGYFDIEPDLTCLGKVIGGGFPVGCYGGKLEIMDKVAPLGSVYQAGTLSGNPVAMAAGIAVLEEISKEEVQKLLEEKTIKLVNGMKSVVKDIGEDISFNTLGSMFCIFFSKKQPKNFIEACAADIERYKKFFHLMLEKGVYLAPSAYETAFLSTAHTDDDLDKTVTAFKESLEESR
jgi:glutamate-1-semialdehyde 2,1-aminomutase